MDPITVSLKQDGADEVKAALKGVQDAIVALDAVSAASARRAGRDRIRAVREEASERKRSRPVRDPLKAATGGSGGSDPSTFRRATKGPTLAEQAGSSSGGLSSLSGTVGKLGAIGGAIALFKTGLDFATDSLKQFGGFLISDVIKPAFALETAAQQLENASGGQIKAADIEAQTRAAALKHNMDPMQLFESVGKMIDLTGDAKTSFAMLDTIGTLSKSRGADAEQLAEFAASLKNFDPSASADQISNLLLTQLAQGDQGSVPLKEAARLGGRLTAPAAFLSGNTDVRMASMGALLQSGRKGFGSTDELMTGIGNLINEVSSQKMVGSKKYLNADGQIGDVASLIGGILKDTGGDAKKIGALGLSDPAAKLVKAYLPKFMEAGKGEQGAKEVEALIRGFMEARTTLASEKENERKVLQTSGEQWAQTIAQIKDRMLEVMPQVKALVSSLAGKAPEIANAAAIMADALIGLASAIEKLIPQTDTRRKRALEKAIEEQKLGSEMSKTDKQISDIDAQLANRESLRKFQPSEVLGSFDAETDAMNAKRKGLVGHLNELSAKKEALSAPEKIISQDEVVAALIGAGKDKSLAESMAKGIAKTPDEYDIQSGALTESLPVDVKTMLETYRDQRLDARDQNVAGGAKTGISDAFLAKMDASSEKLAQAATNLSTATKDANRQTPLAQR